MNEFLANFHFLRPWWLLAVLPAGLAWWLMVRAADPRRDFEDQFAPHLLDALVVKPKDRPWLRPVLVLPWIWVFGVIALAGPAWRREAAPFAEDQAGLYIIARMTPSIESEDLQPSRLERARHKIHDLMELRQQGKTGLIAYAASAHLVMPLTTDATVIEHMFESLSPDVMPGEGDNLVAALELAGERIQKSGARASILLIADGAEPGEAAALAKWRELNPYGVQILAALPEETSNESVGLTKAGDALQARIHRLTPDDKDVTAISRLAQNDMAIGAADDGQRWRDEGWWLTLLIATGAMLWGRKGWSIAAQ